MIKKILSQLKVVRRNPQLAGTIALLHLMFFLLVYTATKFFNDFLGSYIVSAGVDLQQVVADQITVLLMIFALFIFVPFILYCVVKIMILKQIVVLPTKKYVGFVLSCRYAQPAFSGKWLYTGFRNHFSKI